MVEFVRQQTVILSIEPNGERSNRRPLWLHRRHQRDLARYFVHREVRPLPSPRISVVDQSARSFSVALRACYTDRGKQISKLERGEMSGERVHVRQTVFKCGGYQGRLFA